MSHIPFIGSIWAQMSEEVEEDENKWRNGGRGEWRMATYGIRV